MARSGKSSGDFPPVSRRVTCSRFQPACRTLFALPAVFLLPGRGGVLRLVCPLPGSFFSKKLSMFLEFCVLICYTLDKYRSSCKLVGGPLPCVVWVIRKGF